MTEEVNFFPLRDHAVTQRAEPVLPHRRRSVLRGGGGHQGGAGAGEHRGGRPAPPVRPGGIDGCGVAPVRLHLGGLILLQPLLQVFVSPANVVRPQVDLVLLLLTTVGADERLLGGQLLLQPRPEVGGGKVVSFREFHFFLAQRADHS